jgi:hypothetical protein
MKDNFFFNMFNCCCSFCTWAGQVFWIIYIFHMYIFIYIYIYDVKVLWTGSNWLFTSILRNFVAQERIWSQNKILFAYIQENKPKFEFIDWILKKKLTSERGYKIRINPLHMKRPTKEQYDYRIYINFNKNDSHLTFKLLFWSFQLL